ncbi:hypothetical protein QAD02_005120 [Eretmocerus hayati]|uniref:Uncharacterized protein n=1 Tax=Eretmocerus hayati TaxID=131215 RepID=A0ACC2NSM5_9HYME|nr:hypothetical protein QAD02_005120 [Eretmocerus hayati]
MIPQSDKDWKDQQRLKSAIRHGHIELAKRLIQEGVPVNVNFSSTHGYQRLTPLHLAVQYGSLDLIEYLLGKGASVYDVDDFWESPLTLSVRLRKYAMTDLLLTADVLDNFEYDFKPLKHLHIACLRNNITAVEKLIASGADVNVAVDKGFPYWMGYTPLHFAVESQSVDIVKLLLSNGASIMKKDSKSWTPLHLADEIRNETIIDILLSAHMFVLGNLEDDFRLSHFHIACTRNNGSIVKFFLQQGVDVNTKVLDGRNKWSEYVPLRFAILYECPDTVEILLRNGAKLRPLYDHDEAYLGLAYEIGNQKIINLLLNSTVLANTNFRERDKLSKFQLACIENNVERIENLFSCLDENLALDLNSCTWSGSAPLHFLVESLPKDKLNCFQYLHGQGISIKDPRGKTPLHIFFEYRFSIREKSVPSDLLDFEKNPSDNCGLTHFHIVCSTNQVESIEKFLKYEIDVNCTVNSKSLKYFGYTPLHFAVKYEQLDAVIILLKYGAQISPQNGNGLSPFDMAIMNLNTCDFMLDTPEKWEMIWTMLLENEDSRINLNTKGFSLLHIACRTEVELDPVQFSNYVEILPGGINQAIDFPASIYHKSTPLHFASKNKNLDIAKWLIKKGADVYLENCYGHSIFQDELRSRKYDILKSNPELIRVPGNPSERERISYFHYGCINKDRKTIEYYLNSGVDINLPVPIAGVSDWLRGKAPLHLILTRNSKNLVGIVKFLIDNGADVMARDAFFNTPLHCMRRYFNKEVGEILIDHGADVNAQNIFGETPLHKACQESDTNTKKIIFLLENGADLDIEMDHGQTPLTEVCEDYDALPRGKIALTLLKHLKKIMVLGIKVSDENRKIYSKFFERYSFDNFNEATFVEDCLKEIRAMKNLKINQFTSVYNIIFKAPLDMAYLSRNSLLRDLIDTNKSTSNFPLYGYLIQLQYKKGIFRRQLLEQSKQSFIYPNNFSAEIVDNILIYLSDCDLHNMIASK